eukprot:2276541-Rhodomonas_salina.3
MVRGDKRSKRLPILDSEPRSNRLPSSSSNASSGAESSARSIGRGCASVGGGTRDKDGMASEATVLAAARGRG